MEIRQTSEVPQSPAAWACAMLGRLDRMRQDGVLCDTILETPDDRFFLAHSCVLAAASPYMDIQLSDLDHSLESSSVLVPVRGAELQSCLDYMYSGHWKIPLSCNATRLVEVADILGLPAIKRPNLMKGRSCVEPRPDDGTTLRTPAHPFLKTLYRSIPAEKGSFPEGPEEFHNSKRSTAQADEDCRDLTRPMATTQHNDTTWSVPISSANCSAVAHHRCKYCMRTYADKTELLKHEVWHKQAASNPSDDAVLTGMTGTNAVIPFFRETLISVVDAPTDGACAVGKPECQLSLSTRNESHGQQSCRSSRSCGDLLQVTSGSRQLSYRCWQCSRSFSQRTMLAEHASLEHCNTGAVAEPLETSSVDAQRACQQPFHTVATSQHGQWEGPYPFGHVARNHDVDDDRYEAKLVIDENPKPAGKTLQCTTFKGPNSLRSHEEKARHGRHLSQCKCQYCSQASNVAVERPRSEETHRKDLPYRCYFCDHRFQTETSKQEHEKTHRERAKPFECSECKKTFTARTSYIYHRRIHSGEKPFECRYCSKTFVGSGNRNKHESTHSRHKHYKRLLRDKYFADHGFTSTIKRAEERPDEAAKDNNTHLVSPDAADKELPQLHRDKELCQKFHKCHQCKQCFTSRSELLLHLKAHSCGAKSAKRFYCHRCERSFSSRPSLSCHERLHSGEKPYRCRYCEESFVQTTSLRIHESKHTGVKPHACSFCGKSFVFRSAMKAHERTHTKERPYKCQYCDKAYVSSSSRRIHQKTHRPDKNSSTRQRGDSEL